MEIVRQDPTIYVNLLNGLKMSACRSNFRKDQLKVPKPKSYECYFGQELLFLMISATSSNLTFTLAENFHFFF